MSLSIETHTSFEPIEEEWEDLERRSGAPPFLRRGWIAAWWECFAAGELTLLTARRDRRLAGVLALSDRSGVLRSPTNWHSPMFGALAVDAEVRGALARALIAREPRRVELLFVDPAEVESMLEAASGYRLATRTLLRSPYVRIEGSWEDFIAGRSRNLRQGIKRLRRRLEDTGEVELELHEKGELEPLLEECFSVEASGWKGERGTAISSHPETRRFYRLVAEWASREGLLRLALLRLDGRLIAFNLSLEDDHRHYLLKPGYDAAAAALGPGVVLTAKMVEHAFRVGLRSYEFLGGAEPYKLRWGDDLRTRLEVKAFPSTTLGTVDRLVQIRGRALARRMLRQS